MLAIGVGLAPASAAPISLNSAAGQWQNAVLAPADALGPMSVLVIDNVTGNGTDTASWGDLDDQQQFSGSSYLFTPTPDIASISLNTPFLLGTFVHENNPIPSNGITSIDYALSFDIPGGVPTPLPALIHFGHNETLNDPALCPADAIACDDVVTTSLPGVTSFVLGGDTLHLHLLGFSKDGGVTFGSQFFSPEGGSNRAMLYGMVSEEAAPIPTPEPATVVLLGTGLAVAVVAGRRRARRANHTGSRSR